MAIIKASSNAQDAVKRFWKKRGAEINKVRPI